MMITNDPILNKSRYITATKKYLKEYPPISTSDPSKVEAFLKKNPVEILFTSDSYIGIDLEHLRYDPEGEELASKLGIKIKL